MPRHLPKISLAPILAIALCSLQAVAQPPQAGDYSSVQFDVTEERNLDAPVRDGALLKCDIFRPAAEGRFPAILQIT